MKNQSDIVEYAPRVRNKVAVVLIWIGVAVLAVAAIATRNLALIILAVLAPSIAGIFTSRARVKKERSK